jgi:hypothetical protein
VRGILEEERIIKEKKKIYSIKAALTPGKPSKGDERNVQLEELISVLPGRLRHMFLNRLL